MVSAEPASSREQEAAISYDGGNAYVAAGPGTGKTHVLVRRYLRLLEIGVTPERIVVLTFSRRAAAELRERIVKALEERGKPVLGIEVRTFHGFASRLLQGEGARFRTRRLLDGFSRELLLDAAIAATPLPSLSAAAKTSRAFRAGAARVLDDLGRAPVESVARLGARASARLRDMLALHRTVLAARDRLGASDLNDLVARTISALHDPASEASRWIAAHRYGHVLVDEFQDTDLVQLELLEILGARVFAVGDEAQSIYRFRGARSGVVALAETRLNMRRFALTVSRRCPPSVCEFAADTPFVGSHAPRSLHEEGAPVEVVAVRTAADEVHLVADRVEAALGEGVAPGEIAVLLRSTRPFGPLLADELRRRAIPVSESAHDAIFADPHIGVLRAAFAILTDPGSESAWRRFLTGVPLGYDPLAVRLKAAALRELRIDASLGPALEATGLSSARLSNQEVATALLDAKDAWDRGELGPAARRLARGLHLVRALVHDEPPASVRAASGRLRAVCDGLAEAQRAVAACGGPSTCADIVSVMDEHLGALAPGEERAEEPAVRIMSVHAAKGLEFERVVIADAVEGRFPQRARASTLLSAADYALLSESGIDNASDAEAHEREEASLWFVALTRTKARLLVTYASEGLDGGEQRPSRYLAGHIPEHPAHVARGSLEIAALREAGSALRDRLRGERRIAASPSLAAFADAGDAAFLPLTSRPIPPPRRLSVSDVVDWFQCPRRVLYKRYVRLQSEESYMLTLGNALHAVLERFHKHRTDFRAIAAGDCEGWIPELRALRQAVWSDAGFQGVAVEEAAGIFADRALAAYARALERRALEDPFVVEACEPEIGVPVGPLTLQGRIDRVDRRASDGAAIIVDYKVGSAKEKPFQKLLDEAAAVWNEGKSVAGEVGHEFVPQLALYASALEDVAAFSYLYFRGAKNARTELSIDTVDCDGPGRTLVSSLVGDVRAHLAEPLAAGRITRLDTAQSRDACTFCNFVQICPGPAEDYA
jgi:superfamily I DNA/RNA helicase